MDVKKIGMFIQTERKKLNLTQDELAQKICVSNKAVSKWESEQSTPDLEKVIIMSDFFGVTTDYILKGIEPVTDKEQKSKEIASKILYISSTAFVAIGLLCAFGGWYGSCCRFNDYSSGRNCWVFYCKNIIRRKSNILCKLV